MTIVASGPLKFGDVLSEYRIAAGSFKKLGDFVRGGPSGFVRANAADNGAVNGSAGVPTTTTNMRLSHFYGQKIGWTYTNATTRVNNYHIHGEFGADWNGNTWPKTYINNAVMGSNSISYYACVIWAGAGDISFTNN